MPANRRHRLAPNPSGVHHLRCARTIRTLVQSSGVGPGDLVLDLGAGPGTITAPLLATGGTVIAVERDEKFVATLRARFPGVRVVHADIRRFPLPRKPFAVVASIPFAVTTPLLRRLLTPATGHLVAADIIVEWGLAKRLTVPHPRDLESAWWAARFALDISRGIPSISFSPPPRVSAAHLRIRRTTMTLRTQSILWSILSRAHQTPMRRNDVMTPRMLRAAGIDPRTPPHEIPISTFRKIAEILSQDRAIHPPRLPRHLIQPME